jgi:hypothetical protein
LVELVEVKEEDGSDAAFFGDRDRGVDPAIKDVDENELGEPPDVERDPPPDPPDDEQGENVEEECEYVPLNADPTNEPEPRENADEP